jgi:DNA-binding transcriptional ArsR family regulator
MLGEGPRPASAIAAEFELTPPAISQHLKALRQTGLVRVEVDGSRRIYSLHPDGLAGVEDWLVRMRGFWGGRLDSLERALEREKGEGEGE